MAASSLLQPKLHDPLFPSSQTLRTRTKSTSKPSQSSLPLKPYTCSAGPLSLEPASENPNPSPNSNDGSSSRSKDRRRAVRIAWEKLVRWSRSWRSKTRADVLERTNKVVVLGGGSFGTAMAAQVANNKAGMEVNMLIRDVRLCQAINEKHCNFKYFPEYKLPENIVATTDAKAALLGADFCLHAVPVQFSSSFLQGISQHVDPKLPFISLSKGPSFAVELMRKLPTGVEIAGALKNVLAIAAGIVEGMNLGNNCMAALVAQGCSEIRWLATKMGAKSTTLTGLSGSGDVMLTCFVNLSRNRTVGVRLGSGEKLDEILSSMNQVAEGVSTAGAVIALAEKYKVKMPVLTAVARIIDNELTPMKAVLELMSLPQVEEV